MFTSTSAPTPKQEARKLVKNELAAGGLLRRWKSKLHIQPNDTNAIVAALARQGDTQDCQNKLAHIGILRCSGAVKSLSMPCLGWAGCSAHEKKVLTLQLSLLCCRTQRRTILMLVSRTPCLDLSISKGLIEADPIFDR